MKKTLSHSSRIDVDVSVCDIEDCYYHLWSSRDILGYYVLFGRIVEITQYFAEVIKPVSF